MKPRKRPTTSKRRVPLRRQRGKAIILLSKWASKPDRVSLIEKSSGLQHPGIITQLSLSDEPDEFMFIANSGAHSWIFPMLWKSVEVGAAGESVHITEHSRKYGITLLEEPKNKEDETKAAKEQLSVWSKLKTRELYMAVWGNSFPVMVFFGSVDGPQGNDSYVITHRERAFCIIFSMSSARGKVGKSPDDQVMIEVLDRSNGIHIVISETELSADELDERFKLRGSVVN